MSDLPKLHHPWLVAVWPGMGHVALSAGYYLMAKLQMHGLAELSPRDVFELQHVEVKRGLIRSGRLPRSRFFLWKDPAEKRDIIVFIGEAQPPLGNYRFCEGMIEFAKEAGVERVFTFAAMVTQMHPERASQVFAAAIDEESLMELQATDVEILQDGQISGLNGVLLGVAAEHGLRGACLLGEVPHIFAQFPYPKASLAVLQVFTKMANLGVDLSELGEHADAWDEKLGELLAQVENQLQKAAADDEEDNVPEFEVEVDKLSEEDEQRIERLFKEASVDRGKSYELKRELDRLHVFDDYEDRFLDLFKKPSD